MNIDNLVVNYADKKLKEIRNSGFDINVYSNMMEELTGEREFEINGEEYKFVDGYKRDGDDNEYNYGINDNVIADVFIGIYENLNEEQQEEFLNEMLQHTDKNPYKVTEFFEKIKKEKEEQRRIDESSDTSSEDTENDSSGDEQEEENDLSDDTLESNPTPEPENEEKTDEEKTDDEKLSFEHDGPAIKAYKEETLSLEKKLEELLEQKSKIIPNDNEPEQIDNIDINKEIAEKLGLEVEITGEITDIDTKEKEIYEQKQLLKEEIENLNRLKRQYDNLKDEYITKYNVREFESFGLDTEMAAIARNIEIQIKNQESLINNIKSKIDSLEKTQNTFDINVKEDKLIDVYKIREICDKEISRANTILADIEKTKDEYIKEGKGIPFEFYKFEKELQNVIVNSKEALNNLFIRSNIRTTDEAFKSVLSSLYETNNVNNNIQKQMNENYNRNISNDKDDELNPDDKNNSELDNEIEKLKEEISKRKENEKLYYSCLEDIKTLKDAINGGLDPNSEAAKKIIERIDNKKMPLPEELKNELNDYLNMALARERKKIEKIEKNPKKTMRTYLALAAGLGIGGVLGFTLGPVGLAVSYGVVGLSKFIVSKLQKEARDRRINGKKVESIEEPSNKLKAAVQRLKEKALQHEDVLRDINWGLNGALIGLTVGSLTHHISNTIELQKTVHNPNPTPNPTPTNTANVAPTNNIPNVGEHVNGLEYGYRNSLDAAGHVNATHLNQAILNDGKTVIAGYRVGGQTLTNLPAGVTPDAVLLTDGTSTGYRAWAAVEDVVNAVGRSL